ncbi:MAG: Vitamin B12-dependent ribonucleoside-diphosphate reductase [Methanonatronarchaeales archaeon]|nr:Vitamin B12-dependent ribonucleoside-diphosphate reductase [Methanonatronarchaeales archaeon]
MDSVTRPEERDAPEQDLGGEEVEALSDNAKRILEQRYLLRNEDREVIETPAQLFGRVAKDVASANERYDDDRSVDGEAEEFYDLLTNLEFVPNSPTLMNAGTDIQQLSACFVLPVPDSMDGIYGSIHHTAMVHQSGGGTGFSFSRLRPEGDVVRSTGGVASGPISFMEVFNKSTDVIKQGGKRRGANMGMLRVDHPDIERFITAKDDNEALTNFNISVALTEEFMEAVGNGERLPLRNPRSGEVVDHADSKALFDRIAEQAHKNGEPGIVFIDRVNRDNPFPVEGPDDEHWIESTNPCGEQPLEPFEACNLGHVNLALAAKNTAAGYEVDWDHIARVVDSGVRFLDNVVDVCEFPLQEIRDTVSANRKIGLGVMGFHDLLLKLGVPYDSEEALGVADEVMGFIKERAEEASRRIAEERGSFPNWGESRFDGPRRNATLTTIAPTGTTGMIAGVSNGIEPLFALSYVKNVMDGQQLVETNDHFEEVARDRGFYSEELIRQVAEEGSVQGVEGVPEDVRRVFVTAHDITPEWHVRIQAAFQAHVDNAVSKTINFPESATVGDVEDAYTLAYETGCKGLTIYRDGSRDEQVMETKRSRDEKSADDASLGPRERPDIVTGETEKLKVGCGKNLYLTCNTDGEGLFEVFAQLGKSGGCVVSLTEANTRLISLALRAGVASEEIIKQLKGIRCPEPMFDGDGGMIYSCADAIAKSMERFVASVHDGQLRITDFDKGRCPECPDCGAMLVFKEGCAVCEACGYSKCD